MTSLLCLGIGYCATRFVAMYGDRFTRIVATSRSHETKAGVPTLRPDAPELLDAARAAEMVLVSAAPGEDGDPFLGRLGAALAQGRKGPLIYLSTIGVYGDSAGAWIDEAAPLSATAPRGRRRIEAEAGWQALGRAAGRPVAILRLGGIYGPGRNALADLRDGDARCIARAGQVFNRIHVDDIAQAVMAVVDRDFDGAVNVVDDEPGEACAPVRFAASLLGIDPPPAVPFEVAAASMSPMALSFWADNRRVRNGRLRDELGVALRYPTHREGLRALYEAGEGAGASPIRP